MKNSSLDRRTRYSLQAIRSALFRLLEEKELKNITVTDICKSADVNRGTFYKYYADVSDLFSKIELSIVEDVCEMIKKSCLENFSVEGIVSNILDITAENRDFTLMLAKNPTETRYVWKIIHTFRPQFIETIHLHIPDLTEDMSDICFDLIAGGVVMLLMRWNTKEISLSPVQMKKLLIRYINSVLSMEIYTTQDE